MNSSSDQFIYLDSLDAGAKKLNPFTRKKVVYVNDSNNGSYAGQCTIDTSSLSNAGDWVDYGNAYLAIPVVLSLASTTDITASVTPYSLGLKSGGWQLIDSLQVQMNGSNVIQSVPYLNMFTSFKVNSSWSQDAAVKYGPALNFWLDTPDAWIYSSTGLTGGNSCAGWANNRVYATAQIPAPTAVIWQPAQYNNGYLQRLQQNSYGSPAGTGPAGATGPSIANLAGMGISTYQTSGNGTSRTYYWSMIVKIRLRDLSDFFAQIPILKGIQLQMVLNLNTASCTVTSATANTSLNVTNITLAQHTNPMLIAASGTNQPNASLSTSGAAFTCACQVGPVSGPTQAFTAVRLYASAYTLSPAAEAQYIAAHPVVKINYQDVYSFQSSNISGSFNQLLSNGIARVRYIVVIPVYNASANSATGQSFNELASPFSTVPATTSFCPLINNFNVQLGGINVFMQNVSYSHQEYMDEMAKLGLNGGCSDMSCSGLISQYAWQMGYQYYVADLSRRLDGDDQYPLAVLISGTVQTANSSGVTSNLDLYSFITYERSIAVELINGAVVAV